VWNNVVLHGGRVGNSGGGCLSELDGVLEWGRSGGCEWFMRYLMEKRQWGGKNNCTILTFVVAVVAIEI